MVSKVDVKLGCRPKGWLVSIVSFIRPSIMIIASASQFHVYLLWGQYPFSIVFSVIMNLRMDPFEAQVGHYGQTRRRVLAAGRRRGRGPEVLRHQGAGPGQAGERPLRVPLQPRGHQPPHLHGGRPPPRHGVVQHQGGRRGQPRGGGRPLHSEGIWGFIKT